MVCRHHAGRYYHRHEEQCSRRHAQAGGGRRLGLWGHGTSIGLVLVMKDMSERPWCGVVWCGLDSLHHRLLNVLACASSIGPSL